MNTFTIKGPDGVVLATVEGYDVMRTAVDGLRMDGGITDPLEIYVDDRAVAWSRFELGEWTFTELEGVVLTDYTPVLEDVPQEEE